MSALGINIWPFSAWLLKVTWQGSLVVCLIFLIRMLMRNRVGARWQWALWLVLLVRLSLPWAPASRLSIYNVFSPQFWGRAVTRMTAGTQQMVVEGRRESRHERPPAPQSLVSGPTAASASENEQDALPAREGSQAQSSTAGATAVEAPANEDVRIQDWLVKVRPTASLVWLAGAILLGGYVFACNLVLWWAVKHERPVTDQQVLELLEDAKMQMGVQTILGVVVTDNVRSPALFGFVRPRLLLPQGVLEGLSLDELHYVFLHELAHLKRRDIYVGWWTAILQILHWFNPLLWLAFHRMRADQEMACDALSLSRMAPEERVQYGRTIVNLLERFAQPQYVPSVAGILEDPSNVERRMTMIARFKTSSHQWSPLAAFLIAVLAVFSLPDHRRTEAAAVQDAQPLLRIALRRLWSDSYAGPMGAPSPDGRYFSYVDWETGDLALYEIASGARRHLTNKETWDASHGSAYSSCWSPDSQQIVYCWASQARGASSMDLRVIGLTESKARALYSPEWARVYDWSPDGEHILACLLGKDGESQIALVSAADGSVRSLRRAGGHPDWPKEMSFSPNGKYIAYSYPQEGSRKHDISVMSLDGTADMPLVEHPADEFVLGWTPDGRNILFASDRTGTLGIWLIAVADGRGAGGPRLAKENLGPFEPMGYAKTGAYYYSTVKPNDDVYVTILDPVTGRITSPLKKAIQHHEGSNIVAAYAPGGKRFAHVYHDSRGNTLCIRSLETGQEQEFPLDRGDIRRHSSLRWSPDGRSILFVADDEDHVSGVYKIDVETGRMKYLLRSHACAWSAEGETVLYVRPNPREKTSEVISRHLQTGEETVLSRPPLEMFVHTLALSPDGQWLALRGSGPASLKIMPASGGEVRALPEFEKMASSHKPITWTADSNYILFSGNEPGGGKHPLYRISRKSGQTEKLGLKINRFYGLSVHPDGQHILVSCHASAAEREFWVMENLLPEKAIAQAEPATTLREVWSGPGVDTYGGPSPDGRYLSHTDWETGDLAVREIATGNTQRLTEGKTGGKENFRFALNSVISPDGKSIAYCWTNAHGTYDLCVIGIDGSDDRTLYSNKDHELYPACWSSNGKYIAARKYYSGGFEIILVSVADGSVKVLKVSQKITWPRICFASDDRFLVYDCPISHDADNDDIYLLAADGSGAVPLVEHPADDKLLGYIRGRKEILFRSNRAGTRDIWAVTVVDGKAQGPPRSVARDVGLLEPRGVTQDGSLFFSRGTQRFTTEIIPFDARTGRVLDGARKPLLGSNCSPAWSPDGESLAYVRWAVRKRQLYVRDIKTGKERILANEFMVREPRWSPDGDTILFVGQDKRRESRLDHNGGVYTVDVEDGQVTEQVEFPPVEEWSRDIWTRSKAEWARDGNRLFYTSRDRIVSRQVESGQERQLYESDNRLNALDVSPDGQRLVFAERRSSEALVRVLCIPILGGQPTELCRFQDAGHSAHALRQLMWGPDGSYILSVQYEKEGATLRRIPSEGGEPAVVLRLKPRLNAVSIHPHRDKIAISTFVGEQSIWVMEHFLPQSVASTNQ